MYVVKHGWQCRMVKWSHAVTADFLPSRSNQLQQCRSSWVSGEATWRQEILERSLPCVECNRNQCSKWHCWDACLECRELWQRRTRGLDSSMNVKGYRSIVQQVMVSSSVLKWQLVPWLHRPHYSRRFVMICRLCSVLELVNTTSMCTTSRYFLIHYWSSGRINISNIQSSLLTAQRRVLLLFCNP